MGRKIIACEAMKEELLTITAAGEIEYEFVPMGLHDFPDKLRSELQSIIDRSQGYEMIILGFGLCGQATMGLWASHCPLVMPRVHECIPLFFGCCKTYDEIKQKNPGTYFLTGGWTEGERDLLAEFRRTCEKFGPEEAVEIFDMMFKSYNCLMFVNTCHPRNSKAKEYAKEVARLLGLDYREVSGDIRYLERLVNGPWQEDEFIIVDKGCSVLEKEFNRR